jgi:NitT/TauT family transport system substrate-binding protein
VNIRCFAALLLICLSAGLSRPVLAAEKPTEFRVGAQRGLGYLPLYVIDEQGLLAKHAARLGIGVPTFRLIGIGSAAAISEMLLSGSVDAVAGAITPLLTLWDKTRDGQKVMAIASLTNAVLYLNTNNPDLHSLADIGDQDRIALSGVGFSMQAALLQMASGQTFGAGQERRLDALTVSMPHPEALAALLSGNAHIISAHFATPPFQNIELRDPRIHRVMTSTDILGGYSPAALVFTMQRVYDANPGLLQAFVAATEEANAWIEANPTAAADLYLRAEPQKLTSEEVQQLLLNGDLRFSTIPANSLQIAKFMGKIGRLRTTPVSWTDYFLPIVKGPGS